MLALDKRTKQYVFEIPDCHTKLNQYGRLSLLNQEKSYRGYYHSRLHRQTISDPPSHKQTSVDALSSMLLPRRATEEAKTGNPELQRQMKRLVELKLDSPRELRRVVYEGQIKIPTIHNDYHSRASNIGFSRNQTGGIFPK